MSVTMTGATATDQLGVRNAEGVGRVGNTLTYNDVAIGTISGGVNGTALVISFNSEATPARVEWVAKNLAYGSTSDNLVEGQISFTIIVNDGTGGQAQISSNVNVVPINDAPVLFGLVANYDLFVPGGDPVRIDAGLPATLTDVDSSDFHGGGLQVSITGGRVPAEDLLGFAAGSGVSLVNDNLIVNGLNLGFVIQGKNGGSNDFWFLLNSNATPALVTQVIRSITYDNSNPSPTEGIRLITVTVNDGDGTLNGGTDTVFSTSSIEVGHAPPPPILTLGSAITSDVVMNADGTRIYEATNDGFVTVFDAGTGAVLANWDVGVRLGAIALSPNGNYLMAIEQQKLGEIPGISTTVAAYRIDTATGVVSTYPITLSGNGGAFWDVSVLSDNRVLLVGGDLGFPHVLDLTTGAVSVSTTNFGPRPTLSTSSDLSQILLSMPGVSSAPLFLVGLDSNNRLVTRDDTDLFSVPGAAGFSHGAQAVSIEAGYVVEHADGLHVWDLGLNYQFDLNLFGQFAVAGVAFDPDGEFLFVLDSDTDQIQQVSLADYNIVRTIAVGTDVVTNWDLDGRFVTYANRLMLTHDMGRFTVTTGHSIVRIDAAMPSLDLLGDANPNMLDGSIGDDVLNGLGGADTMAGGHGDDIYIVDNAGDVIVEAARKGMDSLRATVSYTLTAGAVLERMFAAEGTAPINLTGNAFVQSITGNAGDNVLDGGGGADTLRGGQGNDSYIVDNAGDVIVELVGEGYDVAFVKTSYTLTSGSIIEGLVALDFNSTAALNLTGNEFDNYLIGNAGANQLNGGTGADLMEGRLGNDIYIIDNTGDAIIEAANQGYDVAYVSVNYVMAPGWEVEGLVALDFNSTYSLNLTGNELNNYLIANAGANTLRGGEGADILEGRGGDDFLDGGTGADTLYGGLGNDTYIIDNAGDVIVDLVGEGYDVAFVSTSYTLTQGASIEGLVAYDFNSTVALNFTGNELDNYLIGNAGANQMSGGTGADLMEGRAGNDIYIIDNTGDAIIEAANQGYDVAYVSVNYVMAPGWEVEGLVALDFNSTYTLNLTGNELANYIIANAGANTLNGGAGADTLEGRNGNDMLDGGSGADFLFGGQGNDIYYIDNAGDQVFEAAGQGDDQVLASVSYVLAAGTSIETLLASSGTSAINLTGNELANNLTGNDGDNILCGGRGQDFLYGGGGADSFLFNVQLGLADADALVDFTPNIDKILLDHNIFTGLPLGVLSANAFMPAGGTPDANTRIIYSNEFFYFDADGSGPGQAVIFATTAGLVPGISASDFVVV